MVNLLLNSSFGVNNAEEEISVRLSDVYIICIILVLHTIILL
jgi:hypothetical protein